MLDFPRAVITAISPDEGQGFLFAQDLPPVQDRGAWLATSTGAMWSVKAPHIEDVDIRSIAAGLSRTCRYGGQIRDDVEFYSVAEHSVLMTRWLLDAGELPFREDALKVLLHDASEAFCGDMPSPAKKVSPEFQAWENRTQEVIEASFGLGHVPLSITKARIKEIDIRIRTDERAALILEPAMSAGQQELQKIWPAAEPLGVEIEGWLPSQARRVFLDVFDEVMLLPLRDARLASLHDWHCEKRDLSALSQPAPSEECSP